jgi:hypothetical protein
MKKLLLIILAITLISRASISQVAINTDGSLPDSSAMLDVKSIDKGMLIPRMTQLQINELSPVTGLLVFNTTTLKPNYYDERNGEILMPHLLYLPSRDELNKLFLSKAAIGGFSGNDYWSSSEVSSTLAISQSFSSGTQHNNVKAASYCVRAIRAF